MRVIDIENIVTNMKDDTRFVLRCEEVFHDKISSAAASILMNKGQKPIVCLTGPSGSGKTTTAMRLREYLENLGVKVCMLSMDNFFLPLDQRPSEASDWKCSTIHDSVFDVVFPAQSRRFGCAHFCVMI